MKLTKGAYDAGNSAAYARLVFLGRIEHLVPIVLSDLYSTVFFRFQECVLSHPLYSRARDNSELALSELISHLFPSLTALRSRRSGKSISNAILDWGTNWHLSDPWCLDAAVGALRVWISTVGVQGCLEPSDLTWCNYSDAQIELAFSTVGVEVEIAERVYGTGCAPILRFSIENRSKRNETFEYPGWNPLHGKTAAVFSAEAKADFARFTYKNRFRARKALEAQFASVVDGHIGHVVAAANELSLGIAHRKDSQHFDWLVQYQVRKPNWSYEQVARHGDAGVSRQTVAEAIKKLARMLGLTLRQPLSAGAPRKFNQSSV